MTVVYGDLRYRAAVMIEASKERSIWRMLVLCRLHSRSFAFSASLCSLCHPTPRTGPRWLLLVLIEPPLESLLCLIPSPLSLPQPDTEFLNKMTQGQCPCCAPTSWSCPLIGGPGPSRRFLLHPPPPSQNQTPGLSTWFPCCPSWMPLYAHRQYPLQRHFQPVLVTLEVMGTKRLEGLFGLFPTGQVASHPEQLSADPVRAQLSPLWQKACSKAEGVPTLGCTTRRNRTHSSHQVLPPVITHCAPASWLNPTLRLG